MPWRSETVVDQRVEFVLRARRGEETLAALCREFAISRPTVIYGCSVIARPGSWD